MKPCFMGTGKPVSPESHKVAHAHVTGGAPQAAADRCLRAQRFGHPDPPPEQRGSVPGRAVQLARRGCSNGR